MRSTPNNKMATKPVFPLLMSMALPPMLSMLLGSLYNIIDSMFVARYSADALTAVSLAFPLQNFALAVSVGAGVGISSYIARKLGEGDRDAANSAVAHGLLLSLAHYLVFVLLGLFLTKPFLSLFTSSPVILSLGADYLFIVLVGCVGQQVQIAIEKMLQATGNMVWPMLMQALGCVVNIILDPIMIFGLFGFPEMGVRGAALATIIGQLASMALAFFALFKKEHEVRLDLRRFKFRPSVIGDIYDVGVPTILMNSLGSVLVMGLNSLLMRFSEVAVSVFGIYYKLQTFVFMPVSGMAQGAMPIMGYNYGARSRGRVVACFRDSLIVSAAILAAGNLLFVLLPAPLLALFGAGPEMMAIGVPALRILGCSYLPAALGCCIPTLFQAVGRGRSSLVIFLLRQFAITLPLAWLLAGPMGLAGIWCSFIVAEVAAAAAAGLMLGQLFRRDPVLCRRDAASAGQAPAEKASGHAAPPAPAPESAGTDGEAPAPQA